MNARVREWFADETGLYDPGVVETFLALYRAIGPKDRGDVRPPADLHRVLVAWYELSALEKSFAGRWIVQSGGDGFYLARKAAAEIPRTFGAA